MADDSTDIERYRKGELTPAEMHALEKRALADPFLAEALEGAQLISPEEFSDDIAELNKKLESGKKNRGWFTPLRIAAGVVVLIGAGYLVYNGLPKRNPEQFAQESEPAPAQTESSTPGDSLKPMEEQQKSAGPLSLARDDQKPAAAGNASAGSGAEKPNEQRQARGDQATGEQPLTKPQAEKAADEGALAVVDEDAGGREKLEEAEKEKIANAPVALDLKKEGAEDRKLARSAGKKKDLAGAERADQTVAKVITGVVTTAEDGLPLPGANILVKGTAIGAVTDRRGSYSIDLSSVPVSLAGNTRLVVSFVGLQTTEVPVGAQSAIDVKMSEDISQVSEVVVTGATRSTQVSKDDAQEPVIKMASPVGGLKAYNKYLEDSLRYPPQALEKNIKGKVTVQFTVMTDGNLSEFNVVKSLGSGCDEEVIRLVKEGPKWNPATEDELPVESEVRVRMKFDPAKAKR